uniref:Uncharacterized protein n=1 Tax=Arundo donax TaxID=35708 RepID=A0A0A9D142_ARUDO
MNRMCPSKSLVSSSPSHTVFIIHHQWCFRDTILGERWLPYWSGSPWHRFSDALSLPWQSPGVTPGKPSGNRCGE